jgi:hypothetical protein
MPESDELLWTPIPDSPQARAYESDADIIGFGGGAGGGKSAMIIGYAITKHRNSLLLRREATQVRTLWDRLIQFAAGHGRANEGLHILRDLPGGRQIQLGGMKDKEDWRAYQGQEYDLMAFDEADQFLEYQVQMVKAWNRTTIAGQKSRLILTFNPPANAEGRWIVEFFAPWLDESHPHPAQPGELRWYVVLDGDEHEWQNGESFAYMNSAGHSEQIHPVSRTFFPALVWDNPYLRDGEYVSRLQSMPEPRRSQLLLGNFRAGMLDDEWQVIPTRWVQLAQTRWRQMLRPDGPLDQVGVDVARGGRDATVLAGRVGQYLLPLDRLRKPSAGDEDGIYVSSHIRRHLTLERSPDALVVVDGIGVGASVVDMLKLAGDVRYYNAIASQKAPGTDASGRYRFANQRSWQTWHLRELLDPDKGHLIALPDDPQLRVDLCAFRWTEKADRVIQVDSREDIVERIGRSPDAGTACILAFAPFGGLDRTAVREVRWNEGKRPQGVRKQYAW